MRSPAFPLVAAALVVLLSTGCGRATTLGADTAAVRADATSAVAALAASSALSALKAVQPGPVAQAESGLEAPQFQAADGDHDGKLSPLEQTALFWSVWREMGSVTTAPAPEALDADADEPVLGTAAYQVPHALKPAPTEAELFIDAQEILPAVYQTLQSARVSICMDVFLLGGAEGRKLAELLVAKAREGVTVRLIHDPGYGLSGAAAAQVRPVVKFLQSQGVDVKSYPLAYMPRRHGHPLANKFQIDHNKFFIVDGATAMIGSMNLIDIGVMNHDVYVRLTGEPARELQAIHDATWKLKGPKTPDFRRDPEPSRRLTAIAPSMARVIKTDIDQQTTKKVLLEDIAGAKKSVHLAIYEFGDQDVATALIAAYKRGVDVRVIADRNANYGKYLDAFKKLKLYGTPNLATMTRLRDAGVPVKWYVPVTADQEVHMKVAVFDGEKAIIGSTNFTWQAFNTFRETSIEVTGPGVAPRLDAQWQQDWETRGAPVTKPTFFEKCVIAAVTAMDKLNLSWW